jgi:hypothetical protein
MNLTSAMGVAFGCLPSSGREVPLIPTLKLRSASASAEGGAGTAPKGSAYTSFHVAATTTTTKAASGKKTPRGITGKKTKKTRPSTPSPNAIVLRAASTVGAAELSVTSERENLVSGTTWKAEQSPAFGGEAVQGAQRREHPHTEAGAVQQQPQQQLRQPLGAVNVVSGVASVAAPRKSVERATAKELPVVRVVCEAEVVRARLAPTVQTVAARVSSPLHRTAPAGPAFMSAVVTIQLANYHSLVAQPHYQRKIL